MTLLSARELLREFARIEGHSENDGTMPTTYYSVKEAAKYLGLSPSRITDLIYEDRLPGARKVGKSWEIPQEALDGYTYKPIGRPKKQRRNRRTKE